MRVVWLAGWYPHTQNPLGGNFIRRHFNAMCESAPLGSSVELFHLAPYFFGNSKPIGLPNSRSQEHIIPVIQFSNAPRFVNALIYYVLALMLVLKIRKSAPALVHVHAADKIGIAAALLKSIGNCDLWLTEHWAIFEQAVPDAFNLRSRWFRSSYRFLWNRLDAVASINDNMYQSMSRVLGSLPRLHPFPNVLDTVFEQDLALNGVPKRTTETFRFLHISNFESRKNVPSIIEAFVRFKQMFPMSQLTLIGGSLSLSEALPDGVAVLGGLPPKELIPFFRNATALILVSEAENAPCVLLESLCYGLPVIVTNVGGIPEMCNAHNAIQIPAFQTQEEKAEKIAEALLLFQQKNQNFDSMQIHKNAMELYAANRVSRHLWLGYQNQ
jgi:glycosyltransferase involved in cell wall biosynthesis